MVPIQVSYIPAGTAARPGGAYNKVGICIHNTGNYTVGATARSHMIYLTKNGGYNSYASYQYIVDDKEIWNLLPDHEAAWHAGDGWGTGNVNTIGIEICVNPDGDLLKATNNAVDLCVYLCKKYGWTAQKNLFQHANFMSKDCPHELRHGKPYSWAVFCEKVRQGLEAKPTQEAPKPVAPKKPDLIKVAAEGSLYRLYNPNNGDHLLTLSNKEANNCQNAGWKYEGIAWVTPAKGDEVYRLVNPNNGYHHFALKSERDALVKAGWRSEGHAFYSGGEGKSIYRMYNPNSGEHVLTTSSKEHDDLTKAGWKCESTKITY